MAYIYKPKLIDEIHKLVYPEMNLNSPQGEMYLNCLDIIYKSPTADVVEVVRCKDCKHATFYSCKNDSCYKGIICKYRIGTDDENFYCSYGERRTDDEEMRI